MTATYSRRDCEQFLGITNQAIGKRIKAIGLKYPGVLKATMNGDRLTDETVELLKLWVDDRTEFERRATEASMTFATVTVAPVGEGITAEIMRRTQEIEATALITRRHTEQLEAFEIPTIEIENIDVDVDELRALLGLSTSREREADAYRQQAAQHNAELERLRAIQDELDIAAIVADEQAKIAREQAIRTQVRKSATGKQIKARAAVA